MIPRVDPGAVLPLFLLAAGALLVLLVETLLGARGRILGRPMTDAWRSSLLALVTVSVLCVVLVIVVQGFSVGAARVFDPGLSVGAGHALVSFDRLANFGAGLAVAGALLVSLASIDFLRELRLPAGLFYTLLLLSTTGMVVTACAADLLLLLVGLELMALPLHVQIGLGAGRALVAGPRTEAALKHFLLASFSTALLLFGAALLYGATGETSYVGIHRALDLAGMHSPGSALSLGGLALLVAGLGFRISAVPFHQWTPDVYEGAPLPTAALLAVAARAAAAIGLLRITTVALEPLSAEGSSQILGVLAAFSLVVGHVMAWLQTSLKRLLAYLVIGQAGFLLMALASGSADAHAALLFQLLAFLVVGGGFFTCLSALSSGRSERSGIDDLRGLGRTRPALAAALTLFAAALAGVPGTVGYVARFEILWTTLEAGHVVLVLLAAISSLFCFLACARIPVHLYRPRAEAAPPLPRRRAAAGEWLVILACAGASLLLGVLPDGAWQGAPEWLSAWLPHALGWARDSVAALNSGLR